MTDFSIKPNGVRISQEGFSKDYRTVAGQMQIPFANRRHHQSNDYAQFYQLHIGEELEEVCEAMERLGITLSFARLIDEKHNWEDYPDSDGLYEYNVKGGVATKVEYKGAERILYFVTVAEGAYTEEGDRAIDLIPRVLEDEQIFTDVILESLGMGNGPDVDPAISEFEADREQYENWYYSLSRAEREEMLDGGYPAPSMMYGEMSP